MDFMHVSGTEMRAAQTVTTATFASFILVGAIPGLRPYAGRVRFAIGALYLATVVGFMLYLLIR